MLRTLFLNADLRFCSLGDAQPDRTSIDNATFGDLDATGTHGGFHRANVFIERHDIASASAEELVVYFRASGASEMSIIEPRSDSADD